LHLSRHHPPVWIGDGGFPVGMVAHATYPSVTLRLKPGDRLAIPSDGITECPGPGGDLGTDGLAHILHHNRTLRGQSLHDALRSSLADHAGTTDFPDDVSAVIFDFHRPQVTA
jgi:sigma-B regulation protein RsbU (phosphoserine phosphatase)